MSTPVDWNLVHRRNYEMVAFSASHWLAKAQDLFESAKRLEPDVVRVWESYQNKAKNGDAVLVPDHFQGPYFMLLAFSTENLLKAAAVSHNRLQYKAEFKRSEKFPGKLKEHDLVKLAKLVGLSYTTGEEDLLRRLTRSAIWFGRYPAPLKYEAMSGKEVFSDGNEYAVSWFGGNDVERLNTFISGLPVRLGFNESR